jgi:hypothetical protein
LIQPSRAGIEHSPFTQWNTDWQLDSTFRVTFHHPWIRMRKDIAPLAWWPWK